MSHDGNRAPAVATVGSPLILNSDPSMTRPRANVNGLLGPLLDALADAVAARLRTDTTAALPRWVPLRDSPLGYRPTLDIIRRGELRVHGIGHRRYVDREAVDRWLLEHPIVTSADAQSDEIDAIIQANRQRKAKRKGAK
jgi:hypothetical protein